MTKQLHLALNILFLLTMAPFCTERETIRDKKRRTPPTLGDVPFR